MFTRIRTALKERDQGFTLIELLVVIIIIGILAAIAIPVFLNQRKKGVDASLKQDLRSMAIAQDTFNTDNPTGPGGSTVAFGSTGGAAYTVSTPSDFQASPGNYVQVALKNGGYCVSAYNTGATTATGSGATTAPTAAFNPYGQYGLTNDPWAPGGPNYYPPSSPYYGYDPLYPNNYHVTAAAGGPAMTYDSLAGGLERTGGAC